MRNAGPGVSDPPRMSGAPGVSVILPAHDEAAYIGACLSALLASDPVKGAVQVIVIANACRDDTAGIARSHHASVRARGWQLDVLETEQPGKLAALNLGDRAARGAIRVYLDADVAVSPPLLAQIAGALDTAAPLYASGTPVVLPPEGAFLRAYTRFWQRLPFAATGVPGFGLFAVNDAGRARWKTFPDIISDDTFVRLHFASSERVRLPATYSWPMIAGLGNLLRVRRRQDDGVTQIAQLYPGLLKNDDTPRPGPGRLARLALQDPGGFAAYAFVKLAVRTPLARSRAGWARGR